MRRWGSLSLLVLAALLGAWGIDRLHTHILSNRLLRTEAARIRTDATLSSFARKLAKPLYESHCSVCHGASLGGNTAFGVPNLTDDDWLYGMGDLTEIERVILYGIRSGNGKGWNLADMPAFGRAVPYARFTIDPLTPQDIRDVVEYLRRLEHRPADGAAALRGASIYSGRGACYDCHGADGEGDTAIGAPNLTDDIWLYGDGSRASVFESIARGHQGSCPAWAKRLSPAQVRALAVFIYETSHRRLLQ